MGATTSSAIAEASAVDDVLDDGAGDVVGREAGKRFRVGSCLANEGGRGVEFDGFASEGLKGDRVELVELWLRDCAADSDDKRGEKKAQKDVVAQDSLNLRSRS